MQTLVFEISLKPFYALDEDAIRLVCAKAFRQWDALIRKADAISVLLWAADGSEILEYAGDLDAKMEWARYLGNSNPHFEVPNDPEKKSLHARSYLYRPDAQPITYRNLAAIIRAWRLAAAAAPAAAGKPFRVGLPFDPGGEFAPSEFKYKRHREICLSDTMGKASFVCCYAVLNADKHPYAGFPEGIPQDTSIGTFLGRQFRHLAADVGLDYIWLSNGFGFGMETWATVGPLFDGEAFSPAPAPQIRDQILDFWKDLRSELPASIGIETRGTNLGTATDLASDATPLRELYEGGFDFAPPVNSPWAALDGDFGLEIAGYMTRVAQLPPERKGFPFRFYLHDPWWYNSPWLDRYEGQPHDIYLPLSVGRVDKTGKIETAQSLSLLTLDDSYGRMPETVPSQAAPHLLRALEERPDAAGPLVWLYPFDEIHDAMFGSVPAPERLFHVDWFMREAINGGLPVNTVVSTRAFAAADGQARAALAGRILVTPAPFDSEIEQLLIQWVDDGGSLLLYGPLTTAPKLRARLGLAEAAPQVGQMVVDLSPPQLDANESQSPLPTHFEHRPILSGGPLCEVAASTQTQALATCTAQGSNESRVLAAQCATASGGHIGWLRAPLTLRMVKDQKLPVPDEPTLVYPFAQLVRTMLAPMGWHIAFRSPCHGQRQPVLALHRNANAWILSGYAADTTVQVILATPFGAPAPLGSETRLQQGKSCFYPTRAWRQECRIFIAEQSDGVISCIERHPAQIGVNRRVLVSGLRDARVRFFPPPDAVVTAWHNMPWPHITGNNIPMKTHHTPHGLMLETESTVTGEIRFSW